MLTPLHCSCVRYFDFEGASSSKPLPPRLSREDASANRELRNALKQAIANIGRVILNSQVSKKSSKHRKTNARSSTSSTSSRNRARPGKRKQQKGKGREGKEDRIEQAAGEPAGELTMQMEKKEHAKASIEVKENDPEENERNSISSDVSSSEEEEEEDGESDDDSNDLTSSSSEEDDDDESEEENNYYTSSTPPRPDSTIKMTSAAVEPPASSSTPSSTHRSNDVNTELSFFHTSRSTRSSTNITTNPTTFNPPTPSTNTNSLTPSTTTPLLAAGAAMEATTSISTLSNPSSLSNVSNVSSTMLSSPVLSSHVQPSTTTSRLERTESLEEEDRFALSPTSLSTQRKLLKMKDKASIQGELDGIRAHLMNLLQQMKHAEEIKEEDNQKEEEEEEYNQNNQKEGHTVQQHVLDAGSSSSTSPSKGFNRLSPTQQQSLQSQQSKQSQQLQPQLLQHQSPTSLSQPHNIGYNHTIDYSQLSKQTDLDLKKQVFFLQQQVENQALKFSVSQADSSFLTDVLAKKDQILSECQSLLVELDTRHNRLSIRNHALEKKIATQDEEIVALKQELEGQRNKNKNTDNRSTDTTSNNNISRILHSNKNERKQKDKEDPPSYDRLMAKLSKLQVELRTSPIKKVATVATAAVHWKLQTKKGKKKERKKKIILTEVEDNFEGDDVNVLVL